MKNIVLFLLTFIISFNAFSQRKGLGKLLNDISDGVKGVKDVVREGKNLTEELARTKNSLKKNWTKDTSSNIRYRQIPDYRSKEEVEINKKQKLKIENGQFVNLNWSPVVNFDNQVFPSFVISWQSYKGVKDQDYGSSLGFKISTNLSGVVLKWEVESMDKTLFNIDSGYVNCDELRGSNFMPKISWNISGLAKQQISTPVNIYFRLIDPNTGKMVEQLQRISLRSITDCVSYYGNNRFTDLFIAYANEDHPEIDKILKEALNTKMVSSISGYQAFAGVKTKAQYIEAVNKVDLQIASVWRALHNRGFQYSSITDNSVNESSGKLYTQSIRPFAMSLKTSQANCVDGSVLIASVMKRMGLRPKLVLIPGHCFLAYEPDNGADEFEAWRNEVAVGGLFFVETVMMADTKYLSKDSLKPNFKKYILPKYPSTYLKTATENDKLFFLQFLKVKEYGFYNLFDPKTKNIWETGKMQIIDLEQKRKEIPPLPVFE